MGVVVSSTVVQMFAEVESLLPLQVRPSGLSSYPRLHRHTKEPRVFSQIWEHPEIPLVHSSISAH